MVPNGWLNTCVDDNITFSGGAQPPRSVFKFEPHDGYIRLIQIRDYKTDKFITYVPKKLARKFCTTEDVMIGRYGPPIFQILRGIEGAYNVALIKAIPNDGVDKTFMYYFLKRDDLLQVIVSFSQRTSGQTGIEMDVLKAYPMHLPPLPEQQKIAKILSTWDKAITTTEKLIATSKQQKKALMQQLLTGKNRLLNPETGKAFEGEWEEVKLNQCLSLMKSGLSRKLESENIGIAVIRSNNIRDKFTSNDDLKFWYLDDPQGAKVENYILDDGDILINFINSLSQIGKTCIYKKSNGLDAIYTTNLLRLKANECVVTTEFLFYLTKTERYKNSVKSITKPAVNQASFTTKEFGQIKFSIPCISEQQKIASVLTSADKEIELLESKLAHLKQEKKALMQQLLTGKRRAKIDDVEVA